MLNKILKNTIPPLILATLYFTIAWTSIQNKSATIDEKYHLTRGIMLLKTGDFRINQHHPYLFNIIPAIPAVLNEDLVMPKLEGNPLWDTAQKDSLSAQLVEINGGQRGFTDNILRGPRLLMISLTAVGIIAFFFILKKVFNYNTALIATILLITISPSIKEIPNFL